jgi:hypothetical protein
LPGNVIGGLSPGLAAELDQYEEEGRNCSFHLLFLSLDAIARFLSSGCCARQNSPRADHGVK